MRAVWILVALGWVACDAEPGIKLTPKSRTAVGGLTEFPIVDVDLAPRADVSTLAANLGQLTRVMLQQQISTRGNFGFSPFATHAALAMVYAGADEARAQELAAAMHWQLPQARLGAAHRTLTQTLTRQLKRAPEVVVHAGNRIWLDEQATLLPDYTTTMRHNFGARVESVPLRDDPRGATGVINGWVGDATAGHIPAILPPEPLGSLDPLVLTVALHFKAAWAGRFRRLPEPQEFHTIDHGTQLTAMMRRLAYFDYADRPTYEAIRIPYVGGHFSMWVVQPKGTLDAFLGAQTETSWQALLANFAPQEVQLTLPRFHLEAEHDVRDALTRLGVSDLFSGDRAYLDGMVVDRPLFIRDVRARTRVDVDEGGTKAAVAVAVSTGDMAAAPRLPSEPVHMDVNRPFLFVIADHDTQTPLFAGSVVDLAR